MGEPGGLPSMGSHRVGHDGSNSAAAAAAGAQMVHLGYLKKRREYEHRYGRCVTILVKVLFWQLPFSQ